MRYAARVRAILELLSITLDEHAEKLKYIDVDEGDANDIASKVIATMRAAEFDLLVADRLAMKEDAFTKEEL